MPYPTPRRNGRGTTERPLPIEFVKAQLKVWEYKWVQTVGNPGPHWTYANKTTETY